MILDWRGKFSAAFSLCLLAGGGMLSGCAIPLPPLGVISDNQAISPEERTAMAGLKPTTSLPLDGNIEIPRPDSRVRLPRSGESFARMFTVTPELAEALHAFFAKDYDRALKALDAAEATANDDIVKYIVSMLRVQTLLVTGHPDQSRRQLSRAMSLEISLFGNNLDSITRMAEERLWSGDLALAETLYGRVLMEAGDWRLPTLYFLPPSNSKEAGHLWIAQIRSFTGMAAIRILEGDYQQAFLWALAGEERFLDFIGITENPLYGLFIEPNTNLYLAHGWNLTMLASAMAGARGKLSDADKIFQAARDNFAAAKFIDGNLAVESALTYVAVKIGAEPGRLRSIGILAEPQRASTQDIDKLLGSATQRAVARDDIALPVPSPATLQLPAVGEKTIYGFSVTPALKRAFTHYLSGEAEEALADIAAAEKESAAPLRRWYLTYLKVQILVMMGRAGDAEDAIEKLEELEQSVFGTNLNARALRGEVRFWLGDYDGAIDDFAQVMTALDGWRMPSLYVFPVPDIPAHVALTRAHFRALFGMAGALMMKGDYEAALKWSREAEAVFSDVFYVVQHPLYGRYAAIDPDLFYARGVNLGILGSASMVVEREPQAGGQQFDKANGYFDALGYAAGRSIVDAFRIRALMEIGRRDLALSLAREAAARASERGLPDSLWRIQAMRGEILLAEGRMAEAEVEFRTAQRVVESVSGALSSDRAKRRFGVGKDDITRRLVEIDSAQMDMPALFADMERGRARAFVDLLGGRRLAVGRSHALSEAIRQDDARMRAVRLRNAMPGRSTPGTLREEQELQIRRGLLIDRLRQQDPELAALMAVSSRELKDIQAKLPAGQVLAYALPSTEGQPFRFLILDRQVASLHTSRLTPEKLAFYLAPFRSPDPLGQAEEQKRAARLLLNELEMSNWGVGKALLIVPSGDLHFVPWGALDINFPVAVLPTGDWAVRHLDPRKFATKASVVGDPLLEKDYPSLPGAREEAQSIGRLYGISPLIGEEATESALRQRIGNGTAILHIAAHGVFDTQSPMNSAILLSSQAGTFRLDAARLFEHPLPAGLVVLSACESGGGTAVAGDDFLGLARSFYLGGAAAMINSLWPVYDRPTQNFMVAFHQIAKTGDYGKAWLAGRDLLRKQGMPPSVYGAFVLGGAINARPPFSSR